MTLSGKTLWCIFQHNSQPEQAVSQRDWQPLQGGVGGMLRNMQEYVMQYVPRTLAYTGASCQCYATYGCHNQTIRQNSHWQRFPLFFGSKWRPTHEICNSEGPSDLNKKNTRGDGFPRMVGWEGDTYHLWKHLPLAWGCRQTVCGTPCTPCHRSCAPCTRCTPRVLS